MEQLRIVDIERANFAMHSGIHICIMSICCNHAHPAWIFLQFGQQLWLMLVVGINTLQTHMVQRSYRIFIAEWFPGGSFAPISIIFRHLPCQQGMHTTMVQSSGQHVVIPYPWHRCFLNDMGRSLKNPSHVQFLKPFCAIQFATPRPFRAPKPQQPIQPTESPGCIPPMEHLKSFPTMTGPHSVFPSSNKPVNNWNIILPGNKEITWREAKNYATVFRFEAP